MLLAALLVLASCGSTESPSDGEGSSEGKPTAVYRTTVLETTQETADKTQKSGKASTPRDFIEDRAAGRERDGGERRESYGTMVTIARVVDGDTIEISPSMDGLTDVRLIGVDTPEISHPSYGKQPYGEQARNSPPPAWREGV